MSPAGAGSSRASPFQLRQALPQQGERFPRGTGLAHPLGCCPEVPLRAPSALRRGIAQPGADEPLATRPSGPPHGASHRDGCAAGVGDAERGTRCLDQVFSSGRSPHRAASRTRACGRPVRPTDSIERASASTIIGPAVSLAFIAAFAVLLLARPGGTTVPGRRASPGREVEMRCGAPAVVVVTVLAVGCNPEQPAESGPEPNWEGGASQVVTLSSRAPQEGTVGVGADSGAGVSPSVYANSFTRGDPLTVDEIEDPDLRPELFEETNLVVLILRRDQPGWFLRGGDEEVGSQTLSQQPDRQWETVARFGPPGQQFEFASATGCHRAGATRSGGTLAARPTAGSAPRSRRAGTSCRARPRTWPRRSWSSTWPRSDVPSGRSVKACPDRPGGG